LRRSAAARAALGLVALLVACSAESLGPHTGTGGSGGVIGSPLGDGGSAGGSRGGGPSGGGGDGLVGGSGGDIGGIGGDTGGVGGVAGDSGLGRPCTQYSNCDSGDFCFKTNGCDLNVQGTCQPFGSSNGPCAPSADFVCGCDGATYGSLCQAQTAGVSVAFAGECPLPEGGPCATDVDCVGTRQYCKRTACGAATGICETMPSDIACGVTCAVLDPPCVPANDPDVVCGCDHLTYANACDAAAHGVSVDSVGACPPLPSGPCTSMADCGGDSYFNLVHCIPNSCDSSAGGTCLPISFLCVRPDGPPQEVCGCDNNAYGDVCDARTNGAAVARVGACFVFSAP
jgi:hypothetical protein